MSDYISRKALLKVFDEVKKNSTKLHELIFIDAVMAIIDNQPTAYDVEKVVSELKSHNNTEKMATVKLYNGEHRYYRAVSVTKAIKIVKGGGVE